MPFVEVKVAGELNTDQKKKIACGIAELLEKEAGKPANATYVVFDEVDRKNWAVGSKLLSES
ncbi:4-oxalocrotonate tautomerase family protein [candidate division WOR-3 bacterium]|nr:4-oxalocrotonate tautomerase family protein [candidate division WOR-3 bacterium]